MCRERKREKKVKTKETEKLWKRERQRKKEEKGVVKFLSMRVCLFDVCVSACMWWVCVAGNIFYTAR